MRLFERKANKAADELFEGLEKRHGNPIVMWIVGQLLLVLLKKLLEKVIEDDGKQIAELARDVLRKVETDE